MSRREKLIWFVTCAICGGVLLVGVIGQALDDESPRHERIVGFVALVVVRAVAFLIAALPLWRRVHNRPLLLAQERYETQIALARGDTRIRVSAIEGLKETLGLVDALRPVRRC